MARQWIKIIILFITVIIIIAAGWSMYKKLKYNKQLSVTNIYEYIPSQSVEVFSIDKENKISEICFYDSSYIEIRKLIDSDSSYPVILCKDNNNSLLLLKKVDKNETENIINHICKGFAISYPPIKRIYKENEIMFYQLCEDRFLIYTIKDGIFAASNSYELIEDFIDTHPQNSLFSNITDHEYLEKKISSSSAGMFSRVGNKKLLALDFDRDSDTIRLNGYVLDYLNPDTLSTDYDLLPYSLNLPENICIETYDFSSDNNVPAIRIILNKMN